jgi:hypothetical protein
MAEFYGFCSMRTFSFAILLPATALLVSWSQSLDWIVMKGDGQLWQGVVIGAVAGFVAACAYGRGYGRLPDCRSGALAAIAEVGWMCRQTGR